MFTPGSVTRTAPHVRDGMDLKRMMITVVVALLPCVVWAHYNTGYQALHAISQGAMPLDTWQTALWAWLGLVVLYGAPDSDASGIVFMGCVVLTINLADLSEGIQDPGN